MIMCGWHHDKLLHKPRIYAQSNRKNKLNKTTAIQLHRKGGQICDQVMNHLKNDFKSWISPLEAMRSSWIPPRWGRMGSTPFTTMGISKDYFTHAHDDPNDFGMGFIMWFLKG